MASCPKCGGNMFHGNACPYGKQVGNASSYDHERYGNMFKKTGYTPAFLPAAAKPAPKPATPKAKPAPKPPVVEGFTLGSLLGKSAAKAKPVSKPPVVKGFTLGSLLGKKKT